MEIKDKARTEIEQYANKKKYNKNFTGLIKHFKN